MANLSKTTQELINQINTTTQPKHVSKEVERIKVSLMASKLAFYYEKLRNTIDYQEEHLLRRNAIRRVLRRLIVVEGRREKVGRHLIYELIRASYLENEKIPVTKIVEVEKILYKYLYLLNDIKLTKNLSPKEFKENSQIVNWVLGIAASELDEELVPYNVDDALVSAMYKTIKQDLVFFTLPPKMTASERDIHIYLAIHRSLIKSDFDILSYKLLKLYYPDWPNPNAETLEAVLKNLLLIREAITSQIKDPLGDKLIKLFKNHSVYFTILKDTILKNPKTAYQRLLDPNSLAADVTESANLRYQKIKTKLKSSVRRSVAYIFITKMALGLALELPYDTIFLGHINYIPLGINIVFHPTMMFLVTGFTKIPGEKNTKQIISGIQAIIYNQDRGKLIYKLKRSQTKGSASNTLLALIYVLMYSISFGLVIYILRMINFNILSGFLFVLFLSIISFFAIRIKNGAKELIVIEKKENFISFIIDFLTVPILRAGRWISLQSSKVNIFIFFLDFIIEAPFKMFLVAFEHLIAFVREKKEDIT
ncbi:hypothetical protein KKA15_01905 [Patescibacteria group bacterium]|nr:hypothetical protein [Patescibacteria group bacterium]